MRTAWIMGAATAAFAGAANAQDLSIEHAAARVVVIPEARGNIQVTVAPGAERQLPAIQVRPRGDRVVVEGGLRNRIEGCDGKNRTVRIRGVGRVPVASLPLITARVPLNAKVGAGQAVFGSIGRTQNLSLSAAGCGDWTVADVANRLELSLAGSGDVRGAGVGGAAEVSVAGAGDVYLASVGRGLETSIAGAGDVRVQTVDGPLSASIVGAGDVIVEGGRMAAVNASIAGAGDVRIGGVASSLSASIMGAGDVRVARVTGPVSRTVMGVGDVVVGGVGR